MTIQEKQVLMLKDAYKSNDNEVQITEIKENGVVILKMICSDEHKYTCSCGEKYCNDAIYHIYEDGHIDMSQELEEVLENGK